MKFHTFKFSFLLLTLFTTTNIFADLLETTFTVVATNTYNTYAYRIDDKITWTTIYDDSSTNPYEYYDGQDRIARTSDDTLDDPLSQYDFEATTDVQHIVDQLIAGMKYRLKNLANVYSYNYDYVTILNGNVSALSVRRDYLIVKLNVSNKLGQIKINTNGGVSSDEVFVNFLIKSIVTKKVIIDVDEDGILDDSDNCPNISNPDQSDNDTDGVGNVCDTDDDNDGVEDVADNCPLISNTDQYDVDDDGIGDVCDYINDNDADLIENEVDNCPNVPNPNQLDTDFDDIGDACDTDDDNDGIPDNADNCSIFANPDQFDNDADNIGNVCDVDDDNDTVLDEFDNCPITPNRGQEDTDSDGSGDICDSDDDNDGIQDTVDNCPLISNTDQVNTDGNGSGDACNDEFDKDGDNYEDAYDNCPAIANGNQVDFDQDGLGDACDPDQDNDGVANEADICPDTYSIETVSDNGCNIKQLCPCDAPRQSNVGWRNHGQYVSCITRSVKSLVKDGLIYEGVSGEITSDAANSSCGAK